MASSNITGELSQAQSAGPSQRSATYNSILSKIINDGGSNLAANIVAYVQSILSDTIGVIHSRPLLSAFVEQYRNLSNNEAKIKAVSYEQQDTDVKFVLADAHEKEEDFTESAEVLQTITLDSSQRSVSDDDKARVWMRICRCYLEVDDSINAITYLNKVKQVIFSVTDQQTRLQFQLSQARIYDSQRSFLDASTSYLALSNETAIDEEERVQALTAAITTAVLAPAGPPRARQLGKLYKDERAAETAEYSILEKIFLNRLLSPSEVSSFAAGLQEHQLAKTSEGSTVLDKAVLEHNLLAISRLYQNISFSNLGALLGTGAERAEQYAATMIESNRLSGSIDQIAGVIHFNTKDGGHDVVAMRLRAWDANVQGLLEEVEKVTTMLQREEPAFFERAMVA
ncbi:hypothetical protein LTR35_009346 [Friedmanniomyces endolithicus]|uniref:COP9 signalosome complex subunit 4 n=1 Tax=Friedmanniomyces endolithicus TaxID=329885 RepID=A0AAN6F5Z0_9PEZI|nr:hypothetical protein LTS00_016404 [Friedmanniomyces endolithicus]KAK0278024.1 hypothetical protein LTR35_009346 [Friedmanniomyces endolithicus]KAK0303982.1 hypothetical protein LTR82_017346 [Friedmanniomyces endolithicus]KAK0974309.1 hypothetical protein LTR54_017117 [Friedmanniomyces endolithicus]